VGRASKPNRTRVGSQPGRDPGGQKNRPSPLSARPGRPPLVRNRPVEPAWYAGAPRLLPPDEQERGSHHPLRVVGSGIRRRRSLDDERDRSVLLFSTVNKRARGVAASTSGGAETVRHRPRRRKSRRNGPRRRPAVSGSSPPGRAGTTVGVVGDDDDRGYPVRRWTVSRAVSTSSRPAARRAVRWVSHQQQSGDSGRLEGCRPAREGPLAFARPRVRQAGTGLTGQADKLRRMRRGVQPDATAVFADRTNGPGPPGVLLPYGSRTERLRFGRTADERRGGCRASRESSASDQLPHRRCRRDRRRRGEISPASQCVSVEFPEPDGPTRASVSPRAIDRSTPQRRGRPSPASERA